MYKAPTEASCNLSRKPLTFEYELAPGWDACLRFILT